MKKKFLFCKTVLFAQWENLANTQLFPISCFETWLEIFTQDMLRYVTEQTNLCAKCDEKWLEWSVSEEELAQFLELCFSGSIFVEGRHYL